MASRKQIYLWKKQKAIPKPKSIEKINDLKLKEEIAIIAIKHYLPFISSSKINIKENNE